MVELGDGTLVVLRRTRIGDDPRVVNLFASCSHATLFQRFHYAFKPTSEAIAGLCRGDKDKVLTVVAQAGRGRGEVVGLCWLAFSALRDCAEYAIMIADDWQGRGLGRLMTSYCLDLAKQQGAHYVTAVTTPNNHRMISVFKDLGFVLEYDWRTGAFAARKQLVEDDGRLLLERTA